MASGERQSQLAALATVKRLLAKDSERTSFWRECFREADADNNSVLDKEEARGWLVADAVGRAGLGVSFRYPLRTLTAESLKAALARVLEPGPDNPYRAALHAAAANADASSYFKLFADSTTAVFLGTDASERWPIDEFREYATKRFEAGDGWLYEVLERHITVHASGEVAWFDERLMNAKLGSCRGSGVLVRDKATEDPLSEANAWRIVQYNLAMAIPNDHALAVAELVKSKGL